MTPAVTQLGAIGSCAFYPNQPAVAMRHRKKGRGQKVFPGEGVSMNIKKTIALIAASLSAVAIFAMIPDIKRYIRISTM